MEEYSKYYVNFVVLIATVYFAAMVLIYDILCWRKLSVYLSFFLIFLHSFGLLSVATDDGK